MRLQNALKFSLILATAGLPLAAAGDAVRQCDTKAAIYCGAFSPSEAVFKLGHGDGKNSAANLQQILLKENRGITQDGLAGAVDGEVAHDGSVTVGQQVVAHDAVVSARDKADGTTKDGSLYSRPAAAAVGSAPAPALVGLAGGKFTFAVIKQNGDPVKGTPGAVVAAAPQAQAPASAAPAAAPVTGGTGEPLPTSGPKEMAMAMTGVGTVWFFVYLLRRSKRRIMIAQRRV